MPEIEETPLPCVGTRLEFTAGDGNRVGVVHHGRGRRELFVCAGDPDTVMASIRLSEDEGHALADILGGSTTSSRGSKALRSIG